MTSQPTIPQAIKIYFRAEGEKNIFRITKTKRICLNYKKQRTSLFLRDIISEVSPSLQKEIKNIRKEK